MQIILGIIFLVLLIIIISNIEALSTRMKAIIFAVIMMILSLAILYEFMFSRVEEHNRKLVNTFMQGKTLICNDNNVSQKNYILERGTLSFMAKKSELNIVGTIYDVEDCSIIE